MVYSDDEVIVYLCNEGYIYDVYVNGKKVNYKVQLVNKLGEDMDE